MLLNIQDIEKLLFLTNRILENTLKLFETKIAQVLMGALIGAFVSIGVFIGTQLWTSKREKKKQRETVLNVITQSHKDLFSVIYEGAQNENNLNYLKLREEYTKIGLFIYMLPSDLKIHFSDLYEIHIKDSMFYKANKHKIPDLCKEIVKKINEYGVDVFG